MSHSLSSLLLLYAQQFEDQHAPQNMTIALREAARELDRLYAGGCARDQGTTQYCAEAARLAAELHIATEWSARVHSGQHEDAAEITALRAEVERLRSREKDITLEGLALIGKIEQVREILAGTDTASLPKDYPVTQMATDRMDEITALRAEVERMRAALDILQAAMTAKKPIPLAFKKAIIEARAALSGDKQ